MARNTDGLKRGNPATQFGAGEEGSGRGPVENAKKSVVKRRRRKKQAETVKLILEQWAKAPISSAKLKKKAEDMGIDTDSGRALIALALIQNALAGNSKYMERLLQLLGEDEAAQEKDTSMDDLTAAIGSAAAAVWGGGDDAQTDDAEGHD